MSIAQEISRLTAAKADIKTAIEGKGVTVPSSTKLDGYADLVDQIQQGGAEEAPENDVNFYDYDGRRIASYTIAEAKALTALPTPPSHDGLTFQEWNWSLADITSYNRRYIDIGANYITTDGKTHIFVRAKAGEDVTLSFTIKDGSVTVDWGDGSSTDSQSGTESGSNRTFAHTYQTGGSYDIKLSYSGNGDFGPVNMNNTSFWNVLIDEIRCGDKISLSYTQALSSLDCAVSISTDTDCNFTSGTRGSSISCLVIPRGTDVSNTGSFSYVDGVVCMPAATDDISGFTVNYGNFRHIIVPESAGASVVPYQAFQQCNNTEVFSIPSNFAFGTRSQADFFVGCLAMNTLDIVQGWIPTQSMNCSYSLRWSEEAMVDFFNKLGTTQTAITLTFGTTNLNRLTAEQKAIATNKGYTLA